MHRILTTLTAAFIVCCVGVLSTISGAAQSGKPAAKAAVANPVPATPQSVDKGKALFQKYCRFCHGDDAKGNGPQAPEGSHPPDLTDAKWDHGSSDADIFAVLKDGVGPKFDMKGFNSKMTPQEMWSVVNYLRSLGPQGSSR
jgi:mono/diheme cytochrome c family protein